MKTRRIISIVVLLFVLLLIGCATVAYKSIPRDVKSFIIPGIGTLNTVYIGHPLVREGFTAARDAISLKESIGTQGWTTYHPAGYYILSGMTDDGYKVYEHNEKYSNGFTWEHPQILEDFNEIVYLNTASGQQPLASSKFARKKHIEDASDEYKQSLIYTGRENDIIKFTYREFSGDMARPAFTIDATYDIKDENIIRFKGVSLEVIEADNQTIKYKLLSGFRTIQE